MNDFEHPSSHSPVPRTTSENKKTTSTSPHHHRTAGMAAVRRILDADGDEMTIEQQSPHLLPEEIAWIRSALAAQLRHASEAVDDGLSALLTFVLKTGHKTIEENIAETVGDEIIGWLHGLLVHALDELVDGAIGKVERVKEWIEGMSKIKEQDTIVYTLHDVVYALKWAIRNQLTRLETQIAQTPDQALWSLDAHRIPARPFWTAFEVANYAFLVYEEKLREKLPVRDQIEHIQQFPKNRATLAKEVGEQE